MALAALFFSIRWLSTYENHAGATDGTVPWGQTPTPTPTTAARGHGTRGEGGGGRKGGGGGGRCHAAVQQPTDSFVVSNARICSMQEMRASRLPARARARAQAAMSSCPQSSRHWLAVPADAKSSCAAGWHAEVCARFHFHSSPGHTTDRRLSLPACTGGASRNSAAARCAVRGRGTIIVGKGGWQAGAGACPEPS